MTPRRIGAALALLGAVLILLGTFSMRWLKAPAPHDGGVGLSGVEMCRDGECATKDWDQLLRGSKDKKLELLKTAALVALIGSVLAASLLGAVGVMGFATPRSLSVPTILSVIGAVLALLGAIATIVLLRRYFKDDEMSFGYSFYLYCAGCVLGAIGSIVSRGGNRYATPRGPSTMST